MIQFPKDFLWGAAAAAYQVEGGNDHADWWRWEKKVGKEPSGDACRHYDLYELDFELAKNLGHNAHRLSIEWSRVEPEQGKFSEESLAHYRKVLQALRARGIEPVVTLHHFTNPQWLMDLGGWPKRQAVDFFLRFAERVVRECADLVHFWITVNEPTIYFSHAYILGVWPPQETSVFRGLSVERHLGRAHIHAYRMIHRIYREKRLPAPAVSFSQHMQAFVPCVPSLKNRMAAWLRHRWFNLSLIDQAVRARALDFIGVNYYSRQLVELKRWGLQNLAADVCEKGHHSVKKNALGWAIYPEGLGMLLGKIKKYKLPIMITENGICAEEDPLRWEFIAGHLAHIHEAMEDGAKVIGYLYWALLDNFEWAEGFKPRFGLIEVDYKTQRRTVRESAKKFRQVCKTGVLQ